MKVVVYCLGASALIFGAIRYGAGPPPKTMTKEWQEMSNEYMKVRKWRKLSQMGCHDAANTVYYTGSKDRSYHWCVVRGLRRPWYGSEQAWQEGGIDNSYSDYTKPRIAYIISLLTNLTYCAKALSRKEMEWKDANHIVMRIDATCRLSPVHIHNITALHYLNHGCD